MSERSTSELRPAPKKKVGNVLFNYALNTFYLRLYGVRADVERSYQKRVATPVVDGDVRPEDVEVERRGEESSRPRPSRPVRDQQPLPQPGAEVFVSARVVILRF